MAPFDVIVVGGGPAGLMAACRAAQRGRKTFLIEKRPRPGSKILLSGGSRCNLTHATDRRGIVEAFGDQGPFLHSALAALGPDEVVELFEAEGVPTRSEANGKIFPRSDRAADVLAALLARLRRTDCTLALDEPVQAIHRTGDDFLVTTAGRTVSARRVVLATGGQSYPGSGSTGDGYRWAASLGHTIVAPRPALVPITTHAQAIVALQGISLPDVRVEVWDPAGERQRPKCLAQRREALLFTHFGVSGPAVLDVSRAVSGHPDPASLVLRCDFLPDVRQEVLEAELLTESRAAGKRLAVGLLASRLPQRLAETIAEQAGLAPERRGAELTRSQRQALARTVKQFEIPVAGTMGFRKAEVTAGGVSLDEVDSRSMESRRIPGLFFAGELLNLDGPIGGYNFQAAFSTGWLSGDNA
jgi:predicted Rossmann fold flavoprotein